jgi:hypothetical protein
MLQENLVGVLRLYMALASWSHEFSLLLVSTMNNERHRHERAYLGAGYVKS